MKLRYLEAGEIVTTHGVRGEVKVYPTTDEPRRFKRLKEVILNNGKEQITNGHRAPHANGLGNDARQPRRERYGNAIYGE